MNNFKVEYRNNKIYMIYNDIECEVKYDIDKIPILKRIKLWLIRRDLKNVIYDIYEIPPYYRHDKDQWIMASVSLLLVGFIVMFTK